MLTAPATATVAAITLDLDDTLWPILPVMERCEQVLEAFLLEHAPAVAQRFPGRAMRTLRDAIAAQRPDLAHDYSAQRRLSLEHAFAEARVEADAPALIERAYVAFYAERNRVQLYDDVADALPALAAHCRVLALTNGNADLASIGVDRHFHGAVLARDVGVAKPDPRIFHHASSLLDVDPRHIWHVGDDPELDVLGAQRAGLRGVWINRNDQRWPHPRQMPDLIIRDLGELTAWLAHTRPA